MNKELVLSKLEELGFSLEEVGECGYIFKYEEIAVLYMTDDDDENFLRFGLPNVFDVTEENRPFVLEIVNATNKNIKYSKTCVCGEDVWIFYEHRIFGNEKLEDVIEHCLLLLQATYYLFYRKIEGDDSLPCDDEKNGEENDERKEDE